MGDNKLFSSMDKLEIRNYKPLGDVVFEYLKNSILSGDLKPGERLMEIAIADQLGVSRTPVREAIRKLEKEKFIIMVPRKGAYVADLKLKDMRDVIELRKLLEGFATELAAERMSDEELEELRITGLAFDACIIANDIKGLIRADATFHEIILNSSRNAKLVEIVKSLHDQLQRFRLIYFNEFNDFLEIQKMHNKILEALTNRDGRKAKEAAENHIKQIEEGIGRQIDEEN